MSSESLNTTIGRQCMVEFSNMHFVAMITKSEYHDFIMFTSGLQAWPSYDDFITERDGYFMGLSWAGENVVQVDVPLRLFIRWVDLTGSPCNLEALDDFAMRRWVRSKYPEWNVCLVQPDLSGQATDSISIPMWFIEEDEGREPPAETSDSVLARVIAEECLDPAE